MVHHFSCLVWEQLGTVRENNLSIAYYGLPQSVGELSQWGVGPEGGRERWSHCLFHQRASQSAFLV